MSSLNRRNLGIGIFVATVLLIPYWVDEDVLLWSCYGVMLCAFSGLYGVRAYLRRLEGIADILQAAAAGSVEQLDGRLIAMERRFLGFRCDRRAVDCLKRVRQIQSQLMTLGTALGMLGIAAMLVLVVTYSE